MVYKEYAIISIVRNKIIGAAAIKREIFSNNDRDFFLRRFIVAIMLIIKERLVIR